MEGEATFGENYWMRGVFLVERKVSIKHNRKKTKKKKRK
jgi:hypothetical protein